MLARPRLLVVGDSFAAEWPDRSGWTSVLAKQYSVTNLAQSGCSQYRILQQIQSVSLSDYDCVIAAHTNPYRVPTRKHPVHSQNSFLAKADLLYSDIDYHSARWYARFNPGLIAAKKFFHYHFDWQYQQDVYCLIRREILRIIEAENILYLAIHTPIAAESDVIEPNVIRLDRIDLGYPNHLCPVQRNHLLSQITAYLDEKF